MTYCYDDLEDGQTLKIRCSLPVKGFVTFFAYVPLVDGEGYDCEASVQEFLAKHKEELIKDVKNDIEWNWHDPNDDELAFGLDITSEELNIGYDPSNDIF